MGNSIPSQINFSKLLAHTFPGILPAIGILWILYLIFLKNFKGEDWILIIGALGGIVFFGTLVGIILDSIHHSIISYFIYNTKSAKDIIEKEKKIFKDKNGNQVGLYYFIGYLPLERFFFIIDNNYSYVECELNLSLSFLFSAIIYSILLHITGYGNYIGIILNVLLILAIFFFLAGYKSSLAFRNNQFQLVQGALENNGFPSDNQRADDD